MHRKLVFCCAGVMGSCSLVALRCSAQTTETLRIAAYNIEADVGTEDGVNTTNVSSSTSKGAALDDVLEGIGNSTLGSDPAHLLDIVGLEENTITGSTDTTNTGMAIADGLNTYYGSKGETVDYVEGGVGSESGGDQTDGNGPNTIIYNADTVQLIASVPIENSMGQTITPEGSTNGIYRQVMRYEFEPVGGTSASAFYVYVVHSKSTADGEQSTDQADRNEEDSAIRTDESSNLPANSSVIYMGDFNFDNNSEAGYTDITASGQGQGIDPLGNVFSASTDTETDTDLEYRDDFEFHDSTGPLSYTSGTFQSFGNDNGTASTAYPFSTASDHLPVVADYTVAVPEPATVMAGALMIGALAMRRRR